ncbi:MAG: lysine biosynthesis protein LysX [Thaumarchaeota archaeon]|nr:lysine biosynthesis protein LysX [Nitrososphaerota archaeon]
MKTLGLIYDRIRWEEKALAQAAKKKGAQVLTIDAKTATLDSRAKPKEVQKDFGDIVLQRCISYFRGQHVTAYLQFKGLNVINKHSVGETCGNKYLTTLALEKAGVPTPRTMFAFTAESAKEAVEKLGYPAVLKPVVGSWGRGVAPLKDRDTASPMIELREEMTGALNQIYYIQEMIKRPPRDIRTIAVGDRIVAAAYRYAPPEDWRTNVARGGRTAPCKITKELEDIALKAADAVGGGVLGVDAMESPDGIVIHEINNTVEFKGASQVNETNIPEAIVNYVLSTAKRGLV